MIEYNRQSVRLSGFDYSLSGYYSVTICTHERQCLFGTVVVGKMVENNIGQMVNTNWLLLSQRYNVKLDEYQIMPDHFHGIVVIDVGAGLSRPLTLNSNKNNHVGREDSAPTLGQIIGYFKYQTTKQFNINTVTKYRKMWQRNYYEHIIRNEKEYWALKQYIIDNPKNWQL